MVAHFARQTFSVHRRRDQAQRQTNRCKPVPMWPHRFCLFCISFELTSTVSIFTVALASVNSARSGSSHVRGWLQAIGNKRRPA